MHAHVCGKPSCTKGTHESVGPWLVVVVKEIVEHEYVGVSDDRAEILIVVGRWLLQ